MQPFNFDIFDDQHELAVQFSGNQPLSIKAMIAGSYVFLYFPLYFFIIMIEDR